MVQEEDSYSIIEYYFCPLYCFEFSPEIQQSMDFIKLSNGIIIRRIPVSLWKFLSEKLGFGPFKPYFSEMEWMASIPINNNSSSKIDQKNYDPKMLFADLITALRLCHLGRLINGPVSYRRLSPDESIAGIDKDSWIGETSLDFFFEDSGQGYLFHESDIRRVNYLLRRINKLRNKSIFNHLDLAIRRFHLAYSGDIQDRFLDHMIALEFLYVGQNQELTYKLALRGAYLLGHNKMERTKIFNDIKRGYEIRSQIVHGNRNPAREELQKIIPKTEEYLRNSLQIYLTLLDKYSLKDLRERILDENILANGTLLSNNKRNIE